VPRNPNDYADHAKNILKRQSKGKIPQAVPALAQQGMGAGAGAPALAPPFVSADKLMQTMAFHPDVHKHISMHIQDRLKKLGG
jgi:hypothetical protein